MSREVSKFLCYVLRHRPAELVLAMRPRYPNLTMEALQKIVATDDKKRYTLRDARLRANQGHSVPGVLAASSQPQKATCVFVPRHDEREVGQDSSERRFASDGPAPRSPLSDAETASHVSARRKGVTVILEVDAQAMAVDGHRFLVSDNRLWLAEAVPLSYLCVASIFPSRA